jgi:hypothetical protein
MRRRLSRALVGLAAAVVAGLPAHAQEGVATEGALFLLLPIGARAVGMGQAVVAESGGSEAVWWNPAGLARADRFEGAIHHSQMFAGTGDAVSVLLPFSLLGVFALSADIVNHGEQETTDEQGTIGTIFPRSFVFAGTYGTAIGTRLAAGVTYKLVQVRLDCTGACPDPGAFSATTTALDLGVQYEPRPEVPVTIGVAVRNVGVRLQVNDGDQADPLPTRLHVGASYRLPPFQQFQDTEVRLAADLVDRLEVSGPSARMGAELVYQRRYFLRAGYVLEDGGGPAIGAGIASGGLVVDISRVMSGLSVDAGEPPMHLSLRYQF